VSRGQPVEPWTVTFRAPGLALVVSIGSAVAGLGLLHLAGQLHSALLGLVGIFLSFMTVGALGLCLSLRVRLDPAGVRIRTGWRIRLVGWAEIRAITIEPRRAGSNVVLWTWRGRVTLPVPMTTNRSNDEPDFLRGYHQIGQYWLAMQAVRPSNPPAYPWPER
jgi:hypothetical protein